MAGQTFVEADIWTVAQTDQGNVVLVRPKGSDLAVPIFIGQLETQSILIGMGGVEVPRPLTHDLAVNLISALGSEVLRVEINDLREQTFFARIILRTMGKDVIVDSRPSDAIGIAVRVACPVFIAESVVEEAGISVNLVNGSASVGGSGGASGSGGSADSDGSNGARSGEAASGGGGADRLGAEEAFRRPPGNEAGLPALASGVGLRSRLNAELEKAIAEEDYERAALIRDELKELQD